VLPGSSGSHTLLVIYFTATSFNCKYAFSEAQFIILEFKKKNGNTKSAGKPQEKLSYAFDCYLFLRLSS
jgi:hypothetical protein